MFTTTKNTLTLLRRDRDTLAIKETIDLENTLTHYGETAASEGNLRYFVRSMLTTPFKYVPDVPVVAYIPGADSELYDLINQDWTQVLVGDRVFYEASSRFNSPAQGTQREINTILLSDATSETAAAMISAYAPLSATFIQEDTDVLDVVYRIEFVGVFESAQHQAFSGAKGSVADMNMSSLSSTGNRLRLILHACKGRADVVLNGIEAKVIGSNPTYPSPVLAMIKASSTIIPPHYEFFEEVVEKDDWIGVLLRSYALGSNQSESQQYTGGALLNSDFPYKPVQVIHNHRATATVPFLDVDHLALGSGTLHVDGANWDLDTPFCDWYYVNIDESGDTGIGEYTLSVRRGMLGFNTDHSYLADFSNRLVVLTEQNRPNIRYHPQLLMDWITFPWIVTYYSTGLTLVNVDTFDYTTWSTDSATNVTPLSDIGQVAIADDGSIWVADRSSGLHKISDPTGNPSVTHFTQAIHGIASDSGCYGVCEGHNESIWAAFDGGLCHTEDGGSSWTIYNATTSPAFVNETQPYGAAYDPTTNWYRILGIYADIEHPSHHLAIVVDKRETGNARFLYGWWWSPIDYYNESNWEFEDLSNSTSREFVVDPEGSEMLAPNFVACSRMNGYWHARLIDRNYSIMVNLEWGVARYKKSKNGAIASSPPLGKLFDVRDDPFSLVPTEFDIDGNSLNTVANVYSAIGQQAGYSVFRSDEQSGSTYSKGTFKTPLLISERWQLTGQYKGCIHDSNDGTLYLSSIPQHPTPAYATNVPLDSYGGKHTVGRDFTVFDYRWNPVALEWQLDYQHPATDISSELADGIRYGFDVQDHTFTGRASIDVSHIVGNLSDVITFCATLEPASAENYNGRDQTIVSFDGLGLLRDTGGYEATNAVYWHVPISGNTSLGGDREHTVNTDDHLLHALDFKPDPFHAMLVTVHTAGPGDNPVNPVRLVSVVNRTPLTENRPYLRVYETITNSILDTYEWDEANRAIRYQYPASSNSKRCKNLIVCDEDKEYTDFSLRFRFGVDNHDTDNRQNFIHTHMTWGYTESESGPSALSIGPNQVNGQNVVETWMTAFSIRFDIPASSYAWVAESGQAIDQDDRDGVNLMEVRFFTLDNGVQWQGEYYRVVNPGPSEVRTLLYTKAIGQSVADQKHNYRRKGLTNRAFFFQMDFHSAGNIAAHSTIEWYRDVDLVDNLNGRASIWDKNVKVDKYVTKVYLDGTLHSETNVALPQFVRNRISAPTLMSNTRCSPVSNPRSMIIGAHKWQAHSRFYRGLMRNIQVWKVAFDTTDVNSDYNESVLSDTGLTSTKPTTELVGHWPLVEDLRGKEAKKTHTAKEVFDAALEIDFEDGLSSPAWTKGDFYTFGVADGILVDNATSFTLRKDVFTKPAKLDWTFIEATHVNPGVMLTTVPAANTTAITEPMTFVGHNLSGTTFAPRNQAPGMLSFHQSLSSSYQSSVDIRSFELVRGDGEYQFRPALNRMERVTLYFTRQQTSLTATKASTTEKNEGFRIEFPDTGLGTFDVYLKTTKVVDARTYIQGDLFRVIRLGAVYSIVHNTDTIWAYDATGDSAFIQISESVQLSIGLTGSGNPNVFYGCKVKTYKPWAEVHLGDSQSQLGRYSPNFSTFAWHSKFWEINLDGNPPANLRYHTPYESGLRGVFSIAPPDPGEVIVFPYQGILVFNPADVGKSIEVNAVLIERK